MKSLPLQPFETGHVVLAAVDGSLSELGFDVGALGSKALGIIEQKSGKRSLVYFPGISSKFWLPHSELKDVLYEGTKNSSFQKITPQKELKENWPELSMIWLLYALSKELEPYVHIEFLDLKAEEIFEEERDEQAKLEEYFRKSKKPSLLKASILIEKHSETQVNELKGRLKERLVFHEILPAGMQKLELAFYLV